MDNLMISSVASMAGLAVLFAAILAFADKKLKVKDDPRVEEISRLLPGVNCGACGFLSCHDFAQHIVSDGVNPAKCRVVDPETKEKLFKAAGGGGGIVYPKFPLIHCAATNDKKRTSVDYKGVATCSGANLIFGGGMKCQYGCMGFGDCTAVCPFDALHMKDGLPAVDTAKCTGCGKCKDACPRKIIEIAEKRSAGIFYVACSSLDNALRVREICGVGCIACGICERISPEKFFKVENNLSRRDPSKQGTDAQVDEIRKISGKCPTKVIKSLE